MFRNEKANAAIANFVTVILFPFTCIVYIVTWIKGISSDKLAEFVANCICLTIVVGVATMIAIGIKSIISYETDIQQNNRVLHYFQTHKTPVLKIGTMTVELREQFDIDTKKCVSNRSIATSTEFVYDIQQVSNLDSATIERWESKCYVMSNANLDTPSLFVYDNIHKYMKYVFEKRIRNAFIERYAELKVVDKAWDNSVSFDIYAAYIVSPDKIVIDEDDDSPKNKSDIFMLCIKSVNPASCRLYNSDNVSKFFNTLDIQKLTEYGIYHDFS